MEIPSWFEPRDGRLRKKPFPHGLRLFGAGAIDVPHVRYRELLERQTVALDAHIDLRVRASLIAEIVAEKSEHFKTIRLKRFLQDLEARILRCVASNGRRIDDQPYLSAILAHRNRLDVFDVVRYDRVFIETAGFCGRITNEGHRPSPTESTSSYARGRRNRHAARRNRRIRTAGLRLAAHTTISPGRAGRGGCGLSTVRTGKRP